MNLHQKFLEKYRQLNKEQRAEIILYLDGEPYTYNPVWVEVYNKTKLAERMLAQLDKEGKL